MKQLVFILLMICAVNAIAQKHKLTQFADNAYNVFYRPIVNNIQMVEVDVNATHYHKYVKEQIMQSDFPPYFEKQNPIYLRNRNGKIIDVFNDDNREYQRCITETVGESMQHLTFCDDLSSKINNDKNRSEAFTFEHFVIQDFRVLKSQRPYMPYYKPSPGIYIVQKKNRFGVIDSAGKVVIPLQFQYIYAFKYGYFVCDTLLNERIQLDGRKGVSQKWGFICSDLKDTIPCEYSNIECVDGTQFLVTKNNKVGIINRNSKIIAPIEYDNIKPTKHFYFYTNTKNEKVEMGRISKEGLLTYWPEYFAIEEQYISTNDDIMGFYYLASTNCGKKLLNQYGNKLCDYNFHSNPYYYPHTKQWKAAIKDSLVYTGFKDIVLDTNFIEVKNHAYYYAYNIKGIDTLIGVLKNENGLPIVKYGIKNTKLILDTVFDEIHFKNQVPNLYFAKRDDKYNIYYNHNGKAVFDTQKYLFFTIAESNWESAIIQGVKEYVEEEVNGVRSRKAVRDCFEYTIKNGVQTIKCN